MSETRSHHCHEIDRDPLIKRLKQNRQMTIVLACISVVSFLIALTALFR